MDHSNDCKEDTTLGAETHLYLIRIWRRKSSDAHHALRGKVQHVVSGEAHVFEGYQGLANAIERMMGEREGARQYRGDE